MTATREIVTDQREQFAFHDDIAYLAETKRGLTRATVEEISGFKNEPDWMLQYRLRAFEHFLKRPLPTAESCLPVVGRLQGRNSVR